MDLVMCPNGHPNRPGRSQCVVCRAPLPGAAADEPPATKSVSKQSPPDASPPPGSETKTTPATPSAKTGRNGWAVLVVIGLIIAGAALAYSVWPVLQGTDEPTLLVAPPATEQAAVVAANTATPTPPPAPTELPPEPPTVAPAIVPTEAPPTAPPPTEVPPTEPPPPTVEPPPTAAPPTTAPSSDDSQPLDHGNLIRNGDFAERWVESWARQVSENNGVQAAEVVAFDGAPAPLGLRLTKSGTGTTRLEQTVAVPRRATELRFTGDVRLVGSVADDGISEGRVALMLIYLDENGDRLGYSVWIDGSQPVSSLWGKPPLPEFGPQLSPHYAPGDGWQTIDVRLQEEFVNRLPGLDPGRVKQVSVNLLAMASDTCGPADCPVALEVANLQLLPAAME